MKFYTRQRRLPTVIIVSLIDILAILLIFVIVTTTFRRDQPEVGERVHHGGDDMQHEEDESHQREIAVHRSAQETRPAFRLEANTRQQPKHDDGAQQQKRDCA